MRDQTLPRLIFAVLFLAALVPAAAGKAEAGEVVDHVKAERQLDCGVVAEEYDYNKDDTHGNMAALGTDICKAAAAAVLGENGKLTVASFPDERHGLEAVASGKIALLAGATPRAVAAALYGVAFGRPFFFDGQGFIAAPGIGSLRDLSGKQVCFISNTEAETMVDAALGGRDIKFMPFPFEEQGEMDAALATGHCAAMTADVSRLAYGRASVRGGAMDYTILPELITLDPLAPAFRPDDPQWAAIVNWTIDATIQAEENGITAGNVEAMSRSEDPTVNRLLTKASGVPRALGLDDDWAVQVIKAVGNYGEMFARDAGQRSSLKLDRGRNALWTQGGLMYSLPNR